MYTTLVPRVMLDNSCEHGMAESIRPDKSIPIVGLKGHNFKWKDPEQAMRWLMQEHGHSIYRYCLRKVGARLADDVQQSTFIDAFRSLHRFQGGSIYAWLQTIAYHNCLDAIKSDVRKSKLNPDEDTLESIADHFSDLEAGVQSRHTIRCLDSCLARLPLFLQQLIHMRFIQGMSYAELAETLSKPANTLQKITARLLPKLRSCIQKKGGVI